MSADKCENVKCANVEHVQHKGAVFNAIMRVNVNCLLVIVSNPMKQI